MLVLEADAACLIDELLPDEVKLLSDKLVRVDAVLDDPAVLSGFRRRWEHAALGHGRPSIPMATFVRLMWLKQTTGWGYERLVAQVSDSLQLRRFCRIPVVEEVPDESTVRKLVRRLGPEVIDEATRAVITKAMAERGFRPRALRADSTVAHSDIRYPTDVGLCADAVRVLAKAARRVNAAVPNATKHVVNRSRAVQKRVRAIGRSLRKRTGEAKEAVQVLTEEAAAQVSSSLRESTKLLAQARASKATAQGVSEKARAKAIKKLESWIGLSARVVEQIRLRFAGEKIEGRLVSLFDPDARPVRRGKLSAPNEFGYVVQLAEVTSSTKPGATALLLPPKLVAGSTHENALLPASAAEASALGIKLREASFDAGFARVATEKALPGLERIFISGSATNQGSARTRRRLAKFRVGSEGRISHFKREYHGGRSRLRGDQGARIWESWAVLAHDIDTVARM
jgi:IS5 family transposase